MVANVTASTTARPTAERAPSALAPATVIPSEPVDLELCRLWRDNQKWLTALGCPNHRPLIENGRFTFFDGDASISIAHTVPGICRLQWAVAGKGRLERRFSSFLLPNGQIASFDLVPGADLWVTISFFAEDEVEVLAGWINGCRVGGYQWIIQGE